jgi:hypothetical protein
MVQRRSSRGFTLKAGQRLRVFGYINGQEFQGDETMQSSILGLVHHTHPPTAQLLDDAVVRNGLADHLESTPFARPY